MINYNEIKERYQDLKSKRRIISSELTKSRLSANIVKRKIADYQEVRKVWTAISKEIQRDAKDHIENIVTMAIQTVFDHPYRFKLLFEEKRNTVTCTPLIVEGENEYHPKDAVGGGMLDVIGFALRITLWSMQNPKSRNIFILDEPFRFTGKLSSRVGYMLRRLSRKLKFQVLLVTHDDSLIDICDRVWAIKNKGYSEVSLIKGYISKIRRKIKRRRKNGLR